MIDRPHLRHLIVAVTLGTLAAACSSKPSTPVRPPAGEPDLWAVVAYLHWGTFPLEVDQSSPAPTTKSTRLQREIPVVVGTAVSPAVRQACVGSFPSYRVHFYVNDSLWWDRETSASAPSKWGWQDLFGRAWTPADTGLYTLRVVLDATNRYAESDETNNQAVTQVHVGFGDLVAATPSFYHLVDGVLVEVDEVGRQTIVLLVVRSHAWGDYAYHRQVLEGPTGALLDRRITLQGGSLFADTRSDTLRIAFSDPGTYVFRFSVDPDGEFEDRDRSNNMATRALVVR